MIKEEFFIMKMSIKKFVRSLLVIGILGLGTVTTFATTFGSSTSGASTKESYQIKYEMDNFPEHNHV